MPKLSSKSTATPVDGDYLVFLQAQGDDTFLIRRSVVVQDNLAASAAPTVGDDTVDGYAVGSRWIDTTNDAEYVCLDASEGAAVWTETTASGGGGSGTQSFVIACSDEMTDLATGAGKVTFRMPYAFTITGVRASVTTAPTGSAIQVDINKGGTSILSTAITIDAGEKTSATAATAAVVSDTSLANDAEMTIDIDAVGSTIAGTGLKVTIIGTQT